MRCRRCQAPLLEVSLGDGRVTYVVSGTDTTADGLTFCPPDPDTTRKITDHKPVKGARNE